ncbi:hypothetical protein OH77DRAFT_1428846 [Trametes cingulata]|nr:hypothetical protein OH77DRAFT_1428846 [Trametes cingulata]
MDASSSAGGPMNAPTAPRVLSSAASGWGSSNTFGGSSWGTGRDSNAAQASSSAATQSTASWDTPATTSASTAGLSSDWALYQLRTGGLQQVRIGASPSTHRR